MKKRSRKNYLKKHFRADRVRLKEETFDRWETIKFDSLIKEMLSELIIMLKSLMIRIRNLCSSIVILCHGESSWAPINNWKQFFFLIDSNLQYSFTRANWIRDEEGSGSRGTFACVYRGLRLRSSSLATCALHNISEDADYVQSISKLKRVMWSILL